MKIYIKYNLDETWYYKPAIVFELFENELFVYEDFYAQQDGGTLDDCALKIELSSECLQFDVVNGRLQI